jgi:GTP-sensing pleiotropic transcriptional regulator CodY
MEGAEESLANIQELLKNAVFLRQQIKYEEARRYVLHILECTVVVVVGTDS